jgi:hypothetical protein
MYIAIVEMYVPKIYENLLFALAWRHRRNLDLCPGGVVYLVVSSPPATEETGAMGSEIKSRQCIGW